MITADEVRQYFSLRGIKTKIRGREVQVEICTFCGNDRFNLELNPTAGVLHCWTCGARGRLDRYLREQFGVDRNIPVNLVTAQRGNLHLETGLVKDLEDLWTWEYLYERGLDAVDAYIYEIFQGKGDKFEGRIVFSLKEYWSGRLVGYNGRSCFATVSPKYYAAWEQRKYITGYRSPSKVHVIVEGNFDGVKVHKAGYNAAVLSGADEKSVEPWVARVPADHHIVILLDGDAFDQAVRLHWRIYPIHQNVKVCQLTPGHDPGMMPLEGIRNVIQEKVQSC